MKAMQVLGRLLIAVMMFFVTAVFIWFIANIVQHDGRLKDSRSTPTGDHVPPEKYCLQYGRLGRCIMSAEKQD